MRPSYLFYHKSTLEGKCITESKWFEIIQQIRLETALKHVSFCPTTTKSTKHLELVAFLRCTQVRSKEPLNICLGLIDGALTNFEGCK